MFSRFFRGEPKTELKLSPGEILDQYAALLQDGSSCLLRPESVLPVPKRRVKEVLLHAALVAHESGNTEYWQVLRTCYTHLAGFVSDEVAARSHDPNASGGANSQDLAAWADDMAALMAEFDNTFRLRDE